MKMKMTNMFRLMAQSDDYLQMVKLSLFHPVVSSSSVVSNLQRAVVKQKEHKTKWILWCDGSDAAPWISSGTLSIEKWLCRGGDLQLSCWCCGAAVVCFVTVNSGGKFSTNYP
mmetsp:Transcript_21040/g.25261  ORF Transcript_21040/g.25261 Transcript_21040/m.25261 type:complete len:113 (+) Transcript_21040:593-931(+)